jgi:hypothetical protein
LNIVANVSALRSTSEREAPRKRRGMPKRALTFVDRRTRVAKRIVELRRLFTDALTSAGLELSPMRMARLETASQAIALAELARGRFLRGETSDLSAVVSAERRADMAVKRLGLYETPRPAPRPVAPPPEPRPEPPTLADYLASKVEPGLTGGATEAQGSCVGGQDGIGEGEVARAPVGAVAPAGDEPPC